MAEDPKQDMKKGFQNNFLILLLALMVAILVVQSFSETRTAKVAFSYQVEHLVNLELIEAEESRKTALNNNLVTFSGRFRKQTTETGNDRYKYLSLLNESHQLVNESEQLKEELSQLRVKVQDAGEWFLRISGLSIARDGFQVIDDSFDSRDMKAFVSIDAVAAGDDLNLKELQRKYRSLSSDELGSFRIQLENLVKHFRSPVLGIGKEAMKRDLRRFDQNLDELAKGKASPEQQKTVLRETLSGLERIADELAQPQDGVRLADLRSVRSYKEAITEYNGLLTQLEDNGVKLDRSRDSVSAMVWYYNNQVLSSRALEQQDPEQFHHWYINADREWQQFETNREGYFKAPDQPINTVLERTFKSEELPPNYMNYFFTLAPVLLVVLLLYFVFSRQMKGVGSSAMNFGRSPAKLLQKGDNKISFKDVAGIDEVIEELEEIVEFLKNPQKFTSLGGHIPKGVLCVGPPGTGKTLVAKAVAGEADRPFFSISGSDFVEMFVGVGASRIRDMFEQAKKNAPCIIFMDEIDAVGRHRGAGIGGGHDEREQTLNQLLVEMDGFDTNDGVILMAATNRPDVLDKALLRPGRFDRRVVISLPDVKGRYEILKVHARKIKMDDTVDLMKIARSTPGCSGADLMNILNESALLAARREKKAVSKQETSDARDKVLYGKERRSLEIDENEKKTTAYHESGHALIGLVVEHSDPVDKVTVIPRGMSLGATMFLPKKNRVSYWRQELIDQLAVLMGGRCAEEIFIGDICSGAQQDIQQATSLARSMVCEWGMNETLGTVAYAERSESGQYLGLSTPREKQYSEATAKAIDEEVRKLIDSAHGRALELIEQYRDQVELLAEMLMEFETLDGEEVKKIIDKEWVSLDDKRKLVEEQAKAAKKAAKKGKAVPPPTPPIKDEGDAPPMHEVRA